MTSTNLFFSVEEVIENDTSTDTHMNYNQVDNNVNLDVNLDVDVNNGVIHLNTQQSVYWTYSVKELMKICQYYGIDKNLKTLKLKKDDIINCLLCFETMPCNFELVWKRIEHWNYMNELASHPTMKLYVVWKPIQVETDVAMKTDVAMDTEVKNSCFFWRKSS